MSSTAQVIDGCTLCNRPVSLHQCEECKVVSYCSLEHQQQHKPAHQGICRKVSDARRDTKRYELRDDQENIISPGQLDMNISNWKGIGDNLEYTTSHMKLIDALEDLNTREALEELLEEMSQTAHLFGNDDENTMEILCLFFRLGRHEEFYNLVKAHVTHPLELPFGRISTLQKWVETQDETSDPFENIEWLKPAESHVDLVLMIMLLKINLLFDLVGAETATSTVGTLVPQEILNHVFSFSTTTSVIANNPKLLSRTDHERVEILRHQIQELYTAISKRKSNVWGTVISGEKFVWNQNCPGHTDFPYACIGNFACGPYWAIDLWHASPWALEYISKLAPVQ